MIHSSKPCEWLAALPRTKCAGCQDTEITHQQDSKAFLHPPIYRSLTRLPAAGTPSVCGYFNHYRHLTHAAPLFTGLMGECEICEILYDMCKCRQHSSENQPKVTYIRYSIKLFHMRCRIMTDKLHETSKEYFRILRIIPVNNHISPQKL